MAAKRDSLDQLLARLNISGLQTKDTPLYEVIAELIKRIKKLSTEVDSTTSSTTTVITSGVSGPPGMPGSDGEDGMIGPPGLIGLTGADGISNVPGPAGPITVGPMGLDGEDGMMGMPIPGNQGVQGIQGIDGPQGPPTLGPMGLDGEDGNDGYPIPGPPGASGTAPLIFLKNTEQQIINAGAGVYTDITGLTFPVINGNNYGFRFYIVFRSAVVATGWKCSVNCPAGTLDFFTTYQTVANSAIVGNTGWPHKHSVTRDDLNVQPSTVTANVDLVVMHEGRYLCTADGTFAARFANELAANTDITVEAGSWGYYWIQ